MEHFSKKYRYLKSKILYKIHRLLFDILPFLTSLFHISSIQTCQKFLNIFVVLYSTDYIDFIREFWKVLEFLLRKIDVFEIQKYFQNSIVYHFLFYFFCIFYIFFFSISPIQSCQKIMEFLEMFYWKDWRFYQRIL